MPIVADFTVLNKETADKLQNGTFEHPYVIGDASGQRFEHTFNTGGRHHASGLLTLMVRELTQGSARVAIKRKDGAEITLGRLQESSQQDAHMWRQQQFVIETNILSSGSGEDNTLVIGRVDAEPTGADGAPQGPRNRFDDFQVRDIVVFFHQAA